MSTRIFSSILVLVLISFAFSGCRSGSESEGEASEDFLFELLDPSKTGLKFVNALEDDPLGDRNVLSFPNYYHGAGLAVGDINNDGLPDVLMIANEGPNRLFLNRGNLEFEDITESSGINNGNKQWSIGAVMADVNGDGWLDIYICQGGYGLLSARKDRENLLFINNGDVTFTESAVEYGINDANESVSAAFFDYDGDGDLDLYVLNVSKYAFRIYQDVFDDLKKKENLENASGNLYRNDGGKFTKVTEEAGLLRYGYGLGLVVADIDGDGLTDIYVANDYSVPDFMFINNGDGTFTDKIKEKTRQISFFGMGCDIADFNNDGFPDIAVVDMAANDHFRDKTLMESMDVEGFWYFVNTLGYQVQYMFNTFQLNNGNGTFSNIAALAGFLRTDWSWSALLADFDNDGYKDYFVTNGYRRYSRDNDFRIEMAKYREEYGGSVPLQFRKALYAKMPEIKDVNLLYKNNRDLTFKPVSMEWGLSQPSFSNGCVYVDLDGDGDLDLIVNNIDHDAFVYKNLSREKSKGNYLQFAFEGIKNSASTYNAKITLYYGDELQYQEYHPTRGYASSMDHMVHFGMGQVETVDSIYVEWLNGKGQFLKDVAVNQRMILKESDASMDNRKPKTKAELPIVEVNPADLGIGFKHTENVFDDFFKEILLPNRQSTRGPKIAIGDVNGDGLDDFYIGGAVNQAGELYIQQRNGKFLLSANQPFGLDIVSEDMGAVFFDADGDGDLDLYVVSGGGGEFPENSPALQDRLYINYQNSGQYFKVKGLPDMFSSGNFVIDADFDGDGDLDLFVGGAAVPGKYPYPSRSYILRNDDKRFTDVTAEVAPELMNPGIVKDAVWADLNGDGMLDLVVVGEWMPVGIYLNAGRKFRNATSEFGVDHLKGWWYSVEVADLNKDGLPDIVLGNVGLNTKFKASQENPFNVFANDFDQDGQCDIVLSKEYQGRLVPSRGRQCSSEQMPFIKEKFPTYKDFASAELKDIFGKDKLRKALHLEVTTFASTVLINNGGKFKEIQLPNHAQISAVMSIIVEDFNNDGYLDILIAGNMYETEVETPRYDAGNGLILLGDGTGHFSPLTVNRSGFFAPDNVKDVQIMKNVAGGEMLIFVANNDGPLKIFKIDNPSLLSML